MTGDMITLGERYRDSISGITGHATARTDYHLGTPNVCLEWRDTNGKIVETWVKEARLQSAESSQAPGDYL